MSLEQDPCALAALVDPRAARAGSPEGGPPSRGSESGSEHIRDPTVGADQAHQIRSTSPSASARITAAAPIAVPVTCPRLTREARTRPRAPRTSTTTPYQSRPFPYIDAATER
jgi:hypothetical protein